MENIIRKKCNKKVQKLSPTPSEKSQSDSAYDSRESSSSERYPEAFQDRSVSFREDKPRTKKLMFNNDNQKGFVAQSSNGKNKNQRKSNVFDVEEFYTGNSNKGHTSRRYNSSSPNNNYYGEHNKTHQSSSYNTGSFNNYNGDESLTSQKPSRKKQQHSFFATPKESHSPSALSLPVPPDDWCSNNDEVVFTTPKRRPNVNVMKNNKCSSEVKPKLAERFSMCFKAERVY